MALDLTFQAALTSIWASFLSAFVGTSIGALLGAIFGAFAAGWIADRQTARQKTIAEARCCNLALLTCHNILNAFANLKSQFILTEVAKYETQREDFIRVLSIKDSRWLPPRQLLARDRSYKRMRPPSPALGKLGDLLEQEIGVLVRAASVYGALRGASADLDEVMRERNEFIMRVGELDLNDEAQMYLYFGEAHSGHRTDTTYVDCMQVIRYLTDNCMVFANIILVDLQFYMEMRRDEFEVVGIKPLKVSLAVEEMKLMPTRDGYDGWLNIPQIVI